MILTVPPRFAGTNMSLQLRLSGYWTSKGTGYFFCLISASHLVRVGPVDAWYFQVQIDLRFSSASLFLQKVFDDSLDSRIEASWLADNGCPLCEPVRLDVPRTGVGQLAPAPT